MKKLLRGMMVAGLLAGVLTCPAWAQTRIGTVDLRKVFDGYWKKEQADAVLKERAADFEKEVKALRDDALKYKEEYQKLMAEANDQAVSSEEREKRKRAAEGKLRSLKDADEALVQYDREARSRIADQSRRMRENLLKEIQTVLNAKARSAGYALVLDTAAEGANGTPVVFFTSGEHDLTDSVLTELNSGRPLESAKPAEKTKGSK